MNSIRISDLFRVPPEKKVFLRMSLPTFLGLAMSFSLFGTMLGSTGERNLWLLAIASPLTGLVNHYHAAETLGAELGSAVAVIALILLWVAPPRAQRRLLAVHAVNWLLSCAALNYAMRHGHERLTPLFALAPAVATALAAAFVLPGDYEPRHPWRWPVSAWLQRRCPAAGPWHRLLSPVPVPKRLKAASAIFNGSQATRWVLSFLAPDLAIFGLLLIGCLSDPEMCGVGGAFMIGAFYAPYAIFVPQLGGAIDGLSTEMFIIPVVGMFCHILLGLGFAWLRRGRNVSWWSSLSTAFTLQIALVIGTFLLLSALGFII